MTKNDDLWLLRLKPIQRVSSRLVEGWDEATEFGEASAVSGILLGFLAMALATFKNTNKSTFEKTSMISYECFIQKFAILFIKEIIKIYITSKYNLKFFYHSFWFRWYRKASFVIYKKNSNVSRLPSGFFSKEESNFKPSSFFIWTFSKETPIATHVSWTMLP